MDDAKATSEEVDTVSSLANDPFAFFNSMENRLGAGRLQHTPSMMEIPSSFIDDVFDAASYAALNDNKDDDADDDDDDDDEDEYEYPSEDKEDDDDDEDNHNTNDDDDDAQSPQNADDSTSKEVPPPPIPNNHSSSLQSDHGVCETPTSPRRRSGCVSDKRIKRLHVVEEYNDDEEHDSDLEHLFYDDEHDHNEQYAEEDEDSSHTMSLDVDLWNNKLDTANFTECNIRFEEDEFVDGKKLSASEFCSLRYFFQFIYDRFHSHSQFLLDTSLPPYSEWKRMRKVRIRNASLKTVDYALKECIKCVDSIKALVRNTIILCYDEKQPRKEAVYKVGTRIKHECIQCVHTQYKNKRSAKNQR